MITENEIKEMMYKSLEKHPFLAQTWTQSEFDRFQSGFIAGFYAGASYECIKATEQLKKLKR